MNIITYIKPVSILKKIFGAIVFIFSFYIMQYYHFLFGCFMLAFSIYLVSSTGSQINLETNKYRQIWSLFSLVYGKWEYNPNFEYISVFKGKQSQKVNSMAASTSFSESVYLINLFYDTNQHKTFYRTFDKEEAFKIAQEIKLALELDILDATGKEQKWLD